MDTYWDRVIASANRLSARAVQFALAGLRRAFPAKLYAQLEDERHPIVALQLTHPGRSRLLELGLAIAVLRPGADDIERLRIAEEFAGCAAEFVAGLMFLRQGVQLVRIPKVRGRKRCEYIGLFPEGRCYAIEVKHLERSDEVGGLEPALSSLVLELMEQMSWLENDFPGTRALFQFSSAVRDLGTRAAVDFDQIRELSRAASNYLRTQLSVRDESGTFELPGLGSVILHPDPSAMLSAAGLEFRPPRADSGRHNRRVRRVLNRAMQQIEEAKLPGIIVLDIERDGMARNTLEFLRRWASKKEGLAAVLVMERHSFVEDDCCAAVDILPGADFDSGSNDVLSLVELCDEGHFHYAPLSALVSPCPLTRWLS